MGPFDNQFGYVKGIFSPLHGHGAISSDRTKIYSMLYAQAAKIWVDKGILSHAISLYAHDTDALTSFFQNGFGMRCIDAMRFSDPIPKTDPQGYSYGEIGREEFRDILALNNALISHMHQSPVFMPIEYKTFDDLIEDKNDESVRYFCAFKEGEIIGYMKVGGSGENFISKQKGVVNICGAYLLPRYRGQEVASQLLSFLLSQMQQDGYSHVGVDFESINPPAREFWLRFFTPYTNSLVRRIDERILPAYEILNFHGR